MKLAEIIATSWPRIPILITSAKHDVTIDHIEAETAFLPKPWRALTLVDVAKRLQDTTTGP